MYYKMPRIALCFSGYFSNKDNDNLMVSSYIYDNIISKKGSDNELDIFIHSFDINNKSNILTKYPTVIKYIIEEQLDFNTVLDKDNIDFVSQISKTNISESWFSSLSSAYSRKQTILLAKQYSDSKNFVYDIIIWVRFDTGIRQKNDHAGYNPCKFIFDPTLDYSYFYSAYWNQLNAGFADLWMVSNQQNMIDFSYMYDYILQSAFKMNSKYLEDFNNWPYSNQQNEFSNEMINPTNTLTVGCKYKLSNSCNNHLLVKHYVLQNGLFYKSKFLDFTHTA